MLNFYSMFAVLRDFLQWHQYYRKKVNPFLVKKNMYIFGVLVYIYFTTGYFFRNTGLYSIYQLVWNIPSHHQIKKRCIHFDKNAGFFFFSKDVKLRYVISPQQVHKKCNNKKWSYVLSIQLYYKPGLCPLDILCSTIYSYIYMCVYILILQYYHIYNTILFL